MQLQLLRHNNMLLGFYFCVGCIFGHGAIYLGRNSQEVSTFQKSKLQTRIQAHVFAKSRPIAELKLFFPLSSRVGFCMWKIENIMMEKKKRKNVWKSEGLSTMRGGGIISVICCVITVTHHPPHPPSPTSTHNIQQIQRIIHFVFKYLLMIVKSNKDV